MIYLDSKVLVKQPKVLFLLFTSLNGTLSILIKKTGHLGKYLPPNLLLIFQRATLLQIESNIRTKQ